MNQNVQDATDISNAAHDAASHSSFMANFIRGEDLGGRDTQERASEHEQDARDYEGIEQAAGHGLLSWLFGGKW